MQTFLIVMGAWMALATATTVAFHWALKLGRTEEWYNN